MQVNKLDTQLLKIRADALHVHPRAQRDIVAAKLKYFMSNFDFDALGVFHAVEGKLKGKLCLLVIDGQHRLRALMELGLGEWQVDVQLYSGLDDKRASQLFLRLNDRSPVSAFAKFEQSVMAGDASSTGVKKLVEERGLRISRVPRDDEIACVNRLTKVWSFDRGETLRLVLQCLQDAFGNVAAAHDGVVVHGVGLVLREYKNHIDVAALSSKLAKYPGGAPGLIGSARGLMEYKKSSLHECMRECVIDYYNMGRRKDRLSSPDKTRKSAVSTKKRQ